MIGGSGRNAAAASLSLYELFFELEDNLCQRYAGLTPFMVRKEKAGEVFLLVKRINVKNNREGKQAQSTMYVDSKGNTHIRRPATNDNWY